MPLVGWRNKNNEFKYTERPIIVIYYDVNYDHQYTKDTQYIRNKIVQVAKNFVGSNLKFAISSEDEYADEIKKLGIHQSVSQMLQMSQKRCAHNLISFNQVKTF